MLNNKGRVFTFLLLFIVVLLGVIWLLNSYNSSVSNTLAIIFVILGVLFALAQWRFPLSPTKGKTPTHTVHRVRQPFYQPSLTKSYKPTLEPLGWRTWMAILGNSLRDTILTGPGLTLLVIFGGLLLSMITIWVLSVIGLHFTVNMGNPFFVPLWIFWGISIFAVRYVYIAGGYLEEERNNATTKWVR